MDVSIGVKVTSVIELLQTLLDYTGTFKKFSRTPDDAIHNCLTETSSLSNELASINDHLRGAGGVPNLEFNNQKSSSVAVSLDHLLKTSKKLEDILASLEKCRTKFERQIKMGSKAKQLADIKEQLTLRYMSLTMIITYVFLSQPLSN